MRGRLQSHSIALRHARAFSLVELLVTLAIILVLFVLLYGFSSKSHQLQQQAACRKNLATILVTMEIFAREHEGNFPIATNAPTSETPLAQLFPQYSAATEIFICPGSKDSRLPEGESFAERTISYAYYMGQRAENSAEPLMSDRQVGTAPKTAGSSVFSADGKPPGNNHHRYGGNFLFVDGRTEKIPALTPVSLAATQGVVLLNPRTP